MVKMKPQLKQQRQVFHDVMIDLETLGTTPGCVILSIVIVTGKQDHKDH
jgi:hypothetical protein